MNTKCDDISRPTSHLFSRLLPPQKRPRLIERPRLIDKLNRALHGNITLLSAPPGYGKTALLSDWISQVNYKMLWLTLEKRDNRQDAFWRFLIIALQQVKPGFGQNFLKKLEGPEAFPEAELMSGLLCEMPGFSRPLLLVFDDFHHITSPVIQQSLGDLVTHLPGNIHICLAGRSQPLLPLAKLRAQNQLAEFGVDDLRFTNAESVAFLNETLQLDLKSSEVSTLDLQCRGWCAALQLAAYSLAEHREPGAFVRRFSGEDRYIHDYISEEIFQCQDDSLQQFLLQTALPDRINGALCDALSGRNDGVKILRSIEQLNLLIFPLDNTRQWYAYHPLFLTYLRSRQTELLSGDLAELHLRASKWMAQNGEIDGAITHALKGGAYDRATTLLYDYSADILSGITGNADTLLNWMQALPENILKGHPLLTLRCALALFLLGHPKDSERYWRIVQDAPAAGEGGAAALSATLMALVALRRGQAGQAVEFGRQAVDATDPTDDVVLAFSRFVLSAGYYLEARSTVAGEQLSEVREICRERALPALRACCCILLADLNKRAGKLHQAAECLEAVWRQEEDLPTDILIEAHALMGSIAHQWYDGGRAGHHLAKIQCMSEGDYPRDSWLSGRNLRARNLLPLLWYYGDRQMAVELLSDQVLLQQEAGNRVAVAECKAIGVRLRLAADNLSAVQRWAAEITALDDMLMAPARIVEQITLAQWLLTKQHFAAAGRLLKRLLQAEKSGGRNWYIVEILILLAVARFRQKLTAQALKHFGEALILAESEGIVAHFVEQNETITATIRELSERVLKPARNGNSINSRHISAGFGRHLFAAINPSKSNWKTTDVGGDETLLDPLSKRELEVLQLVSQGLSNVEIAEKLYLAVSTVKRHLNNIFQKLNVHSRSGAVARARDWRILKNTPQNTTFDG